MTYSISFICLKSRKRAVSSGPGHCPFSRPILAIKKSQTSRKSFLSTGCVAALKRMVRAHLAGVISLISLVSSGLTALIWSSNTCSHFSCAYNWLTEEPIAIRCRTTCYIETMMFQVRNSFHLMFRLVEYIRQEVYYGSKGSSDRSRSNFSWHQEGA